MPTDKKPIKVEYQEKFEVIYDDNEPTWRTNLQGQDDDTAEQAAAEYEDGKRAGMDPGATDSDTGGDGAGSDNKEVADYKARKNAELNKSKAKTPEELREAEKSATEGAGAAADAAGVAEKEDSFIKSNFKGGKGAVSGAAKRKLAYIAAPIILVLMAVIAIFMFVGNLKAVHFATVLRSTGFAGTQLVMRKTFADVSFNASVLSEDSVGFLDRPSRTMFERIRGINPEKVLKQAGREGQFKIVTDTKGKVAGFELQGGKRFLVDDTAQELFGKNFKDLNFREKLTAKNQILESASNGLADVFSAESRTFNNGFMRGFRQYFNIRTSKWAVRARDFFGKNADDALRLQREQTAVTVEEGNTVDIPRTDEQAEKILKTAEETGPKSGLDQVKEGSSAVSAEVAGDIKNGLNARTKDWANNAFKKINVNTPEEIASFTDTAGKVSLAVFATTIYCTARDLDKSLSQINKQKEAKAQRFAHDIQTEADQIKTGHTTQAAVSAANTTWDGHNGAPGAEQSPMYLEATGGSAADAPKDALDGIPTAQMAENPVHDVFSKLDAVLGGGAASLVPGGTQARDAALNGICGVALNPVAQGTIAGIDIIISIMGAASSGGLTEIVKQTLRNAVIFGLGIYGGNELGEWLDRLVREWSGIDFSGAATGVDRYNAGSVATDSMNSQLGRGVSYGRVMTTEESRATKVAAITDLRQRYAKASFKERVFAINNPYSLVGRIAAVTPTTGSSVQRDLAALPATLVRQVSSLFNGERLATLFMNTFGMNQKLYAAGVGDFASQNNFFSVPQWGWTTKEQDIMANDESYSILNNASWVANNITTEESDAYAACYASYAVSDVPEQCTNDFLGTEKALHWRVDKLRNCVIDQLTGSDECRPASSQSDTTPEPATPPTPGPSGSCQAGTDAGIGDGYQDGALQKIQLCKVRGITVNAQVSGNLDRMVAAASAAGVKLTGGGFRTMDSQRTLYAQNCTGKKKCSPPTAKPGYSNHQMGLAIDFGNCGSRGTACYKWLAGNAKAYGFINLESEPWHWSVDGR